MTGEEDHDEGEDKHGQMALISCHAQREDERIKEAEAAGSVPAVPRRTSSV